MTRLAIVDGIRTPFGKAGTMLKPLPAHELGRLAVTALLERTGIERGQISHVIFGNVAQPNDAANIARVIAVNAGIPPEIPAYTVHRNCASGFEAITSAYEKLVAGQGDVFLVGGTESMSNIPLLYTAAAADKYTALSRAKTGGEKLRALSAFRLRDFKPRLGVLLGLTDPTCGLTMGQTAEVLCRDFGISRDQQDRFALASHQKAHQARSKLREEITPVALPGGQTMRDDNGVRENPTLEALTKLAPVFERNNSTVTAGNASQLTDGAVALLVMSEARARQLGHKPLGYLRAYAYTGVEPQRMGIGPAYAIPAALTRAGLKLADLDLVEINEAFAVQVLACAAVLKNQFGLTLNPETLNVNGGAIALGHPVGASAARLVLTLLKEMHRRNVRTGLASACVGGGQGGALILDRE
ncbi:MAG: putative acetyl-CoA acyltransferase [Verrucomicrobiae bacterium]|nr:putative acetyl-CoA acyltransferase [Verrucomicrobiae bacterium]